MENHDVNLIREPFIANNIFAFMSEGVIATHQLEASCRTSATNDYNNHRIIYPI